MTETGRPDARGRDLPEEYRNLSGKIGSPLQQSDQREIRHTIKKAKKFAQKARVKITRALVSGQRERAFELQHRYLTNYHFKLAATYEANKKLRRKGRGVPLEDLPGIAAGLCAREGTQEEVRYYFKQKPSGQGRPILDYGIENRALQKLVNRAMEPFITLHPNQYAYYGGRDAACQALREAIEDGFKWVTEIDVRDCYPSFDEEKIHNLLPLRERRVVDHVIAATHLNLVPYNPRDWGARSEVRTGLPQGSATSALVAETMLKPTLKTLTDNVHVINYADNIWLLTRTKGEACASQTLSDALAHHPAGPLTPRIERIRRVNWGFPFLGYRVKGRRGTVIFELVEAKFEDFERIMGEHLREDQSALFRGELQTKSEDYVKSFWSSFSLDRDWEAVRDRYLREISNKKAMTEAIIRNPQVLGSFMEDGQHTGRFGGLEFLIEVLRNRINIDLRV